MSAAGAATKRRRGQRRPDWRKLGLLILAAAALAAVWRYTPLKEFVAPENITRWARTVREVWWAPIVLVLAYTPAAVLMIPRPVLTLLAVIAFGVWLGLAYAAAGIMVAALATYYAGRVMPEQKMRRLAGAGLDPAVKVLRKHAVVAMFVLNQVPVPPFAVQGLIAGGIRVNAWHYTLGSLLGIAPALAAWTVFGDQLTRALEDPSKISWWLVALALVMLAVLTYFVRQWFAKQVAAQ
jgi:phospholipase D1/2